MKKRFIFLLLLSASTVFIDIGFAAPAPAIKTAVTVAVFRDARPAVFIDERGEPAGIYPDILRKILQDSGYRVRFILFNTFQEALASVTVGKVDIMPAMLKTPRRQEILDFSSEPIMTSWGQVLTAKSSQISSITDLRNKKIGVQKGGQNGANFIIMMEEFNISFSPVEYDTFGDIVEAMISGEIDAGVFFSTYQFDDRKIKPTNIIFAPAGGYIAVRKGTNGELLQAVDKAVIAAKQDDKSFYYEIFRNYQTYYRKEYMPTWLIILLAAVSILLVVAASFVILLQYLVKKTTSRLIVEKERAEENDRLKTGFLLKISHELRTPLNGIVGMQELLRNTELDGQQRLYLYFAGEAAQKLTFLIQELLDFQESSRTEIHAEIKDTDILGIMDLILPPLRSYAEKNNTMVRFESEYRQLHWPTDEECLRQILIQLILNAVDFSDRSEVTVQLRKGENLDIIIRDGGIGIEERLHDDIFIPFHQLEDPYTRRHGGLGLGLSIVRQLCRRINAEIYLNSAPEKGTEIILRLPVRSGHSAGTA